MWVLTFTVHLAWQILFHGFLLLGPKLPVDGRGDRLQRSLALELAHAHDASQATKPHPVAVVKPPIGVQQPLRQRKQQEYTMSPTSRE